MSVVLLVGTKKGAAVLRSDNGRQDWSLGDLALKGWIVTAATRDEGGRTYAAVASDVYGPAIVVSDDFETWRQLENGPRYGPDEAGNEDHNRLIGAGDPLGQFKGGNRHLDQIWKLHAVGDTIYAGVSEAGLFRSDDRGETWEPVRGLNDHPTRANWLPGAGGLCAHTFLADARHPERMWVGISAAGVFRTDDGGATWTPKNDGISADAGFCIHSLAHDPDNADTIYRQDHRGMYRTDDGGDSWVLIENGLPRAILSDDHECVFGFPVAFDPASDTAFAVPLDGDNFRYPPDGKLRVYRTRDHGAQWETLGRGLPDDCYATILRGAMAVDHLDPCGVYFGTTAGTVYASADGGDSWQQIPGTLPRVLCVEAFRA